MYVCHPVLMWQVTEQVEVLRDACNQLHGSKRFKRMLQAVLQVGNHLNEVRQH